MTAGLRGVAAALLMTVSVAAVASDIAMHRDPGCGCCEVWAQRVRAQFGRAVRIVDDTGRQARFGVPRALASCHTAIVDGLMFEGHVPIADMKRVLAARPRGVRGLAVPGMPIGSPGMEMRGMRAQAYDVIAFGPAGTRVYAHHGG